MVAGRPGFNQAVWAALVSVHASKQWPTGQANSLEESLGSNRVNLRVSLIVTATLSLSAGLALAKPAEPAAATPFPVSVFAITAQAATQGLPAAPAPRRPSLERPATQPAIQPAALPTTAATGASKIRYSPGGCLVWGPKRIEDNTYRNCVIAPSFVISSVPIVANVAASG